MDPLIRSVFLTTDLDPLIKDNADLNNELYLLVALILRQFVLSWYAVISNDREVLVEITHLLSRLTNNLKHRIENNLDFENALLDDIPYIVSFHIDAYYRAKEIHGSSEVLNFSGSTISEIFASIRGHPGMANQSEYLAALSRNITFHLGIDDGCVRALMSSIIHDVGLKNCVERLSEPWFIHEIIIKLAGEKSNASPANSSVSPQVSPANPPVAISQVSAKTQLYQYYYTATRVVAKVAAFGLRVLNFTVQRNNDVLAGDANAFAQRRIFSLVNSFLQLERFRPLLSASFRVMSRPLSTGWINQITSKSASFAIRQKLAHASTATSVIRLARNTLFPDKGFMGPPRIIPTTDEQVVLRERASASLKTLLHTPFIAENFDPLEVFDDKEVNKHLMLNLIDYLVIALIPEIQTT